MRTLEMTAAMLLIAVSATAQETHHQHADHAEHHTPGATAERLPEGWHVRVDRDQVADDIMFHAMDDHFHVRTGPAGVFYNPEWEHAGEYTYSARFRQNTAPTHPESYGLVIGGTSLDSPDQAYTYLLVRGTGEYFIASRTGEERTIHVPWTAHEAVNAQDDDSGVQLNELAAAVGTSEVAFLVNGEVVARLPHAEIQADGIAGFRVNHRLDVRIDQVRR